MDSKDFVDALKTQADYHEAAAAAITAVGTVAITGPELAELYRSVAFLLRVEAARPPKAQPAEPAPPVDAGSAAS